MKQKFIITQSVDIKNKLIANGAKLISDINGTYTFLNELPKNFTFDNTDKSKIVYSNILSL